jgi:hypothetical protein
MSFIVIDIINPENNESNKVSQSQCDNCSAKGNQEDFIGMNQKEYCKSCYNAMKNSSVNITPTLEIVK